MRWVVALTLLVCASCLQPHQVSCGFGVCALGTVCDEAHDRCVKREQKAACAGMQDGMLCSTPEIAEGLCDQGVCFAEVCGDGYRHGQELCDGDDFELGPDKGEPLTCRVLGFYDPLPMSCNRDCNYERLVCDDAGRCGDNIVQAPIELCEPGMPPDQTEHTCTDLGFHAGFLDCTNACGPDVDLCKLYGWNPPRIAPGILRDLHASAPINVIAVGDDSTATRFNGVSWSQLDLSMCISNPTARTFNSVWTFGPNATFIATTNGVVMVGPGTCAVALGGGLYDAVWGSSATNVYVSGTSGVRHFNGVAWTSVATGLTSTGGASLWGSGPNDVWIGQGAQLRRWNGSTWQPMTVPNVALIKAIWGSSPTDVYVAGRSSGPGSIVMHYNGTWKPMFTFSGGNIASGAVLDGRVFVGGNDDATTTTPDTARVFFYDGRAWFDLRATTAAHPITGITPLANGKLYGVTEGGAEIMWFEGTHIEAGSADFGTQAGNKVQVRASNEAYAVAVGGSFVIQNYLHTWNGAAWSEDTSVTDPEAIALHAPSGRLYAVSADGLRSKTSLTGTWTVHDATATRGSAMFAVAEHDVWFFRASPQRELVRWNGTSVTSCATCAVPGEIAAIWGSASNDVFAVGRGGSIQHWNGTAWTSMSSGVATALFAVWGSGPDDVVVVGDEGVLLEYDGTSWKRVMIGTSFDLSAVWGTGAGDVFVTGEHGIMVHRDRLGRWAPAISGSTGTITSVSGVGDVMFYVDGTPTVRRMIRTHPW